MQTRITFVLINPKKRYILKRFNPTETFFLKKIFIFFSCVHQMEENVTFPSMVTTQNAAFVQCMLCYGFIGVNIESEIYRDCHRASGKSFQQNLKKIKDSNAFRSDGIRVFVSVFDRTTQYLFLDFRKFHSIDFSRFILGFFFNLMQIVTLIGRFSY